MAAGDDASRCADQRFSTIDSIRAVTSIDLTLVAAMAALAHSTVFWRRLMNVDLVSEAGNSGRAMR
jgi:hypothetical protein